jgi:hypothetical protein
MKYRVFFVILLGIVHLAENGPPASFRDVLTLLAVVVRAWRTAGEVRVARSRVAEAPCLQGGVGAGVGPAVSAGGAGGGGSVERLAERGR